MSPYHSNEPTEVPGTQHEQPTELVIRRSVSSAVIRPIHAKLNEPFPGSGHIQGLNPAAVLISAAPPADSSTEP